MQLKCEIFAFVYEWLRKNKDVKDQNDLAVKTGIRPATVSAILNGKSEPNDKTLERLNDCFKGIFNMRYLHGHSIIMFTDDLNYYRSHPDEYAELRDVVHGSPSVYTLMERRPVPQAAMNPAPYIDQSSLVNALIAAHADTVAALKRELVEKDDHITTLRSQLADKDRTIKAKDDLIAALRKHLSEAYPNLNDIAEYPFPIGVANNLSEPQYNPNK